MADNLVPKPPEITEINQSPEAPVKIYFNGFSLSVTPADVILQLLLDGRPLAALYCSHVVSKTLADKLNKMIEFLGSAGLPFKSLDENLEIINTAAAGVNNDAGANNLQPELSARDADSS